jgi:hypothetical protein
MKTIRELMTEKPLKFCGREPRPDWTVSIRNGVQGLRLLVGNAKTGRTVTETGMRRLKGALVVEALHLVAESKETIPALITFEERACFHSNAIEHWAACREVALRYEKPDKAWEKDR